MSFLWRRRDQNARARHQVFACDTLPQAAGNAYEVPSALADLSVYFQDAQIVWRGAAAYSANSSTAALITNTPGATALTALSAGDEIWVKY